MMSEDTSDVTRADKIYENSENTQKTNLGGREGARDLILPFRGLIGIGLLFEGIVGRVGDLYSAEKRLDSFL